MNYYHSIHNMEAGVSEINKGEKTMIGDRHVPRPSVPHYTMKGGSHYVFGKKTSEENVEGGGRGMTRQGCRH